VAAAFWSLSKCAVRPFALVFGLPSRLLGEPDLGEFFVGEETSISISSKPASASALFCATSPPTA